MNHSQELFTLSSGHLSVVNPNALETKTQRLEAMFAFLRERHLVYLRRKTGQQGPWTQDYALRNYRFCNIYRELDVVTEWVVANLLEPNRKHPDLWFYAVVARMLNKVSSLQHLLDLNLINPDTFNAKKFESALTELQREQPVFNAAYIINGISPKGKPRLTKIGVVAHYVLAPMLKQRSLIRKSIDLGFKCTLEQLRTFYGMGAFMANQVAVDLSYMPEAVGGSPDIDTTVSPGPGTMKGIRFLLGDSLLSRPSTAEIYSVMETVRKASYHPDYWPKTNAAHPRDGWVPLTMPNVSNALCETSKIMGLVLGTRARLKNTYPGNYTQVDMFQ